MTKSKLIKITVPVLIAIFAGIQFIPVEKTNPPVTGDIDAPPAVSSILKRACYDCHSNETKWPWYSKIAPVSLLIANDVNEGREYLNFSIWKDLSEEGHQSIKMAILEKISKGEMPLPQYKLAHPEAKLTDYDKKIIKQWIEPEKGVRP
ncbi:heme-binding domain-containing protein [Desulforegula conservatrix]|uniref:heme-binding domain-containing protein n=1 Tax=Desulforegula conservatrix TaxID=153026 RepID=UPI000684913D|nr:heme-binding domain-containing protein [Desulforegula conservatrix]